VIRNWGLRTKCGNGGAPESLSNLSGAGGVGKGIQNWIEEREKNQEGGGKKYRESVKDLAHLDLFCDKGAEIDEKKPNSARSLEHEKIEPELNSPANVAFY